MFKYFSLAIALFGLLSFMIMKPFEIVDTGHRGVKVTLGKVDDTVLTEGMYFFNPITSSIKELNVQTNSFNKQTLTYTKDIQQATIAYVMNYNLEPEAAAEIYKNVGVNWDATLVPQIVEGTLKSVIGQWDAVDLIANRNKATSTIENAIATALKEKHVVVTKFEITNIDYNDEFEKAVEAKVTAVQRAAEEQNKTVQIQEQAKQKVITAQAEAQAMKIKSDALSQNQNLVAFEAVQKWNGVLPVTVLGDSVPFINIAK